MFVRAITNHRLVRVRATREVVRGLRQLAPKKNRTMPLVVTVIASLLSLADGR